MLSWSSTRARRDNQKRSPNPFSESFLIKSSIPYQSLARHTLQTITHAYLWHDALSVLALDIAEWHFCALVLVDTKFRIINIWNFVKRNYVILVSTRAILCISLLRSCTISLVTLTAVSVVICFGPRRRPWNPFFLNSDVLSRTDQLHEKTHNDPHTSRWIIP